MPPEAQKIFAEKMREVAEKSAASHSSSTTPK
jgi:hypothetical protein